MLAAYEATTERKRVNTNEISTVLDSTVAALQGGVQRLGVDAALPVIESWEKRLGASGDPELTPIAGNLGALRAQLSASDFDQAAVGQLLATLGEQVQRVANTDIQIEVADKLSQLSVLLSSEGDSLSGQ
jgi:hypothetical protein